MVAAPRGHPNQNHHYSVTTLCRLLDLPRSSYYYQPTERDDATLRQAIEAIAAEFPTYGSRRIMQQLRRPPHQIVINRKQVQGLMGEMGLKRIHSALGYLTPVEFEVNWKQQQQLSDTTSLILG